MQKFKQKLPTLLLWQFLLELLAQPNEFDGIIRYTDRDCYEFIIVSTRKLAKKWGQYKLNNTMTYAKMGHSMREYTKQGILKKGNRNRRIWANRIRILLNDPSNAGRTHWAGVSLPAGKAALPHIVYSELRAEKRRERLERLYGSREVKELNKPLSIQAEEIEAALREVEHALGRATPYRYACNTEESSPYIKSDSSLQ